jgi:hypothetical protein
LDLVALFSVLDTARCLGGIESIFFANLPNCTSSGSVMSVTPSDVPGFLRVHSQLTPSPDDPKGADQFYRELGVLMVAWGRLEGHFVLCLITALAIAKDKKLGYRIPHTWDQCAEKWKTAFDTILELKSIRPAAVAILAEIEDVAKDRNLVAHALWEVFVREEPLRMNVLTIKSKPKTIDGLDITRAVISIDALREISSIANMLNMKLHNISGFLSRVRGPPPSNARIV